MPLDAAVREATAAVRSRLPADSAEFSSFAEALRALDVNLCATERRTHRIQELEAEFCAMLREIFPPP
jgi:hypothetical protein